MAEMTREVAIDTLKRLKITHIGDFGWDTTGVKALEFAIFNMKRVDELEAENITLKESLTNTLKTNEGYRSELKHFKDRCKELEAKNKELDVMLQVAIDAGKKLEAENERYDEKVYRLTRQCAELEAENKRLKEGIEEVKAEIEANEDFIYSSNDFDILPKKVRIIQTEELLDIIDKYLGE